MSKDSIKNQLKTYLKVNIEDIKRYNLKGNEIVIYALIKSFCLKNKKFFMSRKNIAKKYLISEATVPRIIKKLEEKDIIKKIERQAKTNVYILNNCIESKSKSIKCYDVISQYCTNVNEFIILSCIIGNYNTCKSIQENLNIPKRTILDNIWSLKEKGLITSDRKTYEITYKVIDILKNNDIGYNQERTTKEETETEPGTETRNNIVITKLIDTKELDTKKKNSVIICNFKTLDKDEIKDIHNNSVKYQEKLTVQEKIDYIISLYNQAYTEYKPCKALKKEEYNKLVEMINNYDLNYITRKLRAHLEDRKTQDKYHGSYQLNYVISNITSIKESKYIGRLYFKEDWEELERSFYN